MNNNNNIFDLDFPRTVMLEKVHPFISIILKSLNCELMDIELYFHNYNFIIYQESKIVGKKIYGDDFVLARAIYFNMEHLKILEKSATHIGIIGRSDWFWLASQCFNNYVCKLRSYLTVTGLLFMHKNSKYEFIKSLIEKNNSFPVSTNPNSNDTLLSNDLPVRKCNTTTTATANRLIIKEIFSNSSEGSYYYKDEFDVNKFKLETDWWLKGEKNVMKTRFDFHKKTLN